MVYAGCERQLIYSHQSASLYHYTSKSSNSRPPILIVFALVNSPTILDLHPKRSFIQHLLDQDLDVYFLEWGKVSKACQSRGLQNYIFGDLHQAVSTIHELSAQRVHIMGVCQGGYFSVCYTATFPEKIASLITIVTPIDFEVPGNRLIQITRFIDVDGLVDHYGNVPGSSVNWVFQQIEPFRIPYKKFLAMQKYCLQQDKEGLEVFNALEAWAKDCPDQAGETFREFVKVCIQQNVLVKNQLSIGDHPIALSALKLPILNIYAIHDHLWPTQTVRALSYHHASSRYQEYAFEGGHVGVFASQHALKTIPVLIRDWILPSPEQSNKTTVKY